MYTAMVIIINNTRQIMCFILIDVFRVYYQNQNYYSLIINSLQIIFNNLNKRRFE